MFGSNWKKVEKLLNSEINRARRFQFAIGILELEVQEKFAQGIHYLLPGATINIELLKGEIRAYDQVIKTAIRRFSVVLPSIKTSTDADVVRKRILDTAQREQWGAVNIGIAVYPFDGDNAHEILKKARRDTEIK
jgi:hypothetical protein